MDPGHLWEVAESDAPVASRVRALAALEGALLSEPGRYKDRVEALSRDSRLPMARAAGAMLWKVRRRLHQQELAASGGQIDTDRLEMTEAMFDELGASTRAELAASAIEVAYFEAAGILATQLSQEEAPRIQGVLARAIGILGDEKLLPVLKQASRHDEAEVRMGALEGLFHQSGLQRTRLILERLPDSEARVAELARDLLEACAVDEVLTILEGIPLGKAPGIRRAAIPYLLALPDRRARALLVQYFDDGDRKLRAEAVLGLAKRGAPEAEAGIATLRAAGDAKLKKVADLAEREWKAATPEDPLPEPAAPAAPPPAQAAPVAATPPQDDAAVAETGPGSGVQPETIDSRVFASHPPPEDELESFVNQDTMIGTAPASAAPTREDPPEPGASPPEPPQPPEAEATPDVPAASVEAPGPQAEAAAPAGPVTSEPAAPQAPPTPTPAAEQPAAEVAPSPDSPAPPPAGPAPDLAAVVAASSPTPARAPARRDPAPPPAPRGMSRRALGLGLFLVAIMSGRAALWYQEYQARQKIDPVAQQLKRDFNQVLFAVESHEQETGRRLWSTRLDSLVPDRFEEVPGDPWGNHYRWDPVLRRVISLGPDGIADQGARVSDVGIEPNDRIRFAEKIPSPMAVSYRNGGRHEVALLIPGTADVHPFRIEGATAAPIMPRILPSGAKLAYLFNDPKTGALRAEWRRARAGISGQWEAPVPLLPPEWEARGLTWIPDGSGLVVLATPPVEATNGGQVGLYLAGGAWEEPVLLGEGLRAPASPRVSDDGARVCFSAVDERGTRRIGVLGLPTEGRAPGATVRWGPIGEHPLFGPGGKSIWFVRNREDEGAFGALDEDPEALALAEDAGLPPPGATPIGPVGGLFVWYDHQAPDYSGEIQGELRLEADQPLGPPALSLRDKRLAVPVGEEILVALPRGGQSATVFRAPGPILAVAWPFQVPFAAEDADGDL